MINAKCKVVSSTSIAISWNKPRGIVSKYLVSCISRGPGAESIPDKEGIFKSPDFFFFYWMQPIIWGIELAYNLVNLNCPRMPCFLRELFYFYWTPSLGFFDTLHCRPTVKCTFKHYSRSLPTRPCAISSFSSMFVLLLLLLLLLLFFFQELSLLLPPSTQTPTLQVMKPTHNVIFRFAKFFRDKA